MDNETIIPENITEEDIDKAFADAFGSDDVLFGEEDGGVEEQGAEDTATAGTATEDEADNGAEGTPAPETATETEDKPEETAPATTPAEDTHEVDKLRAELEKARGELAKMRRRDADIAEHMKSEGYDSIDAELAERMGMSLEDYEKHIAEESDAELAEKYRKLKAEQEEANRRTARDDLFRRDEREILEYDPQLKGRFTKLEEAPFFKDFAILRSMGKSVIDAYRMANYSELSEREVKAMAAQTAAADNRGHMTSSATKQSGAEVTSVPAGELAAMRDLFPDMSDAEIDKLYKRINK